MLQTDPSFLQPTAPEGESSPPSHPRPRRMAGVMGEGRGRTPKSLWVHTHTHTHTHTDTHTHRHRHTHTHTHTHTAGRPVSIRCSLQCDPSRPSQPRPASPLQGQKRRGGHRKEVGTGWRKAGEAGWRGSAPQAGIPPGPAHSGSELRWASEGASSPFVAYLSAPLPNILSASSRYSNLCSPCGVWRGEREPSLLFRPHGEPWELREELRPEWGGRPPEP